MNRPGMLALMTLVVIDLFTLNVAHGGTHPRRVTNYLSCLWNFCRVHADGPTISVIKMECGECR